MMAMIDNEKNLAAVALGRLGRGKPKNITDEEREARSQRMKRMQMIRKERKQAERGE